MSFEVLLYSSTFAAVALASFVLLVALRGRREPAAQALGEGRFREALDTTDVSATAERDSLYTAAVAAKHLLEWDRAEHLLRRILDDDDDGEAWLELGLVETYRENYERAMDCFVRAERLRGDLLESLTLHRAFVELRRDNSERGRFLFEEIEVPLETKLRTDMGAGEPLFVEWFLQSAALWQSTSKRSRADWARSQIEGSDSRLHEVY